MPPLNIISVELPPEARAEALRGNYLDPEASSRHGDQQFEPLGRQDTVKVLIVISKTKKDDWGFCKVTE